MFFNQFSVTYGNYFSIAYDIYVSVTYGIMESPHQEDGGTILLGLRGP